MPRRACTRVLPGDPRYPSLVRGFNQRFVGRPRLVALCADAAEVREVVQEAVDGDLRLTVKSGGHCYEDFAVGNDGGVIVDLSLMTSVSRDGVTGWYGVGAGANLWDVYRILYTRHGVVLPGGSCYSVGVGGHVLGGGYGPLSRREGLISDYLAAVELVHVTAEGRAEVVIARRDAADPDARALVWAHQGGGGGNFGVVTRLWFADPPRAPVEASLLDMRWAFADLDEAAFSRLVSAFGTWHAANSGPESPYRDLSADLELNHRAAGAVNLGALCIGDRPDLIDDLVSHLSAAAPKAATSVRRLPWLQAMQTINASGPNRRAKYKSAYLNQPFPEREIPVIWKHLTTPRYTNPDAVLSVSGYGGRINVVDPAATAVAQRASIMKLQYLTFWTDPAEDALHLGWIRDFYDEMYGPRGPLPDGVHDGCFVNYPDVDLAEWPVLYYKDNYARLRAVKGRWDPRNVFHHAQSIAPP